MNDLQRLEVLFPKGKEERLLQQDCYPEYSKAAHCAIYSSSDQKVFAQHPVIANVLMQMRFDGKLGFPGGEIDKNEDAVEGLNRELSEEINFNKDKFHVSKENYLISIVNHDNKCCYHFYYLHLSEEDFNSIERGILYARDFGNETLGSFRVPLYTFAHNRGFPAFLQNNFIGHAKYQLCYFLGHCSIIPVDELIHALKISQEAIEIV